MKMQPGWKVLKGTGKKIRLGFNATSVGVDNDNNLVLKLLFCLD